MTPTRRRFLGTVTATTAVGLAGCLGGDGAETPTEAPTTEQQTEPDDDDGGMDDDSGDDTGDDAGDDDDQSAPTVRVSSHPDHGEILVDGEGMVLYMFDADTQGEAASACPDFEGCDEAWPPLAVEDPADVTAGEGVEAELSTFERDDGTIQVTANGWPLYYFAQDEEPGDAAGQGVNDVWWVLNPSGEPRRPASATVAVASHEEHGDILVDGEGMTLYMFDSDEQGAGESTCYDGCAEAWPPLTAEADPEVGDGVTAEIETFERDDGTRQVAANGWPLYYYAQDESPGDAAGQGVNDVWWVLDPAGEPVKPDSDDSGGVDVDGGGGSY